MEKEKKVFASLWDKIEENYNWERVYDVMKALDWMWNIHDEDYGIPNISTIKRAAKKLLLLAYEKGGTFSSGGFIAQNDDGELSLSFSVEEIHTMNIDN